MVIDGLFLSHYCTEVLDCLWLLELQVSLSPYALKKESEVNIL